MLLQVLTLLDKNLKPFAITSIALYNSNQLLREGYQKVEFYCSNGGKDVNCAFLVQWMLIQFLLIVDIKKLMIT